MRQVPAPDAILHAHATLPPTQPSILVIGYGNTLRGDDALGPEVATLIEQQKFPGVFAVTVHQLTPELADPISAADAVVFIDASSDPASEVSLRPLAAADQVEVRPHFGHPAALLKLAAQTFQRCPAAWLLTVPGFDFGFKGGLSARAQAAAQTGLAMFTSAWRHWSEQGNCDRLPEIVRARS